MEVLERSKAGSGTSKVQPAVVDQEVERMWR